MAVEPLALGPAELSDEVVRLRPWRVEDAPDLAEAWADPAIAAGSVPPSHKSEAAARRWIKGCETRRQAGLAYDLVVADPSDDTVLGEIGLSRIDPTRRTAMIGWWVAASARRRGVATAAVGLVADWALVDGALLALAAEISADNRPSAVVAERAGFERLNPEDEAETIVYIRRA